MSEPDRWAEWLVRGRQLGATDEQIAQLQRHLGRLRDRVLKGAELRKGERVLDVGAGTGLVALGARGKVGARGRVIASDISLDALRIARTESVATDGKHAPIAFVGADATALPFADRTFDAVTTRSVLIYLDDKRAGVAELYRVLCDGGRVSIFEPINETWRANVRRLHDEGFYDDVRPEYDEIIDAMDGSRSASVFHGWDERDLVRWFEDAGFTHVCLEYTLTTTRPRPPARVTDEHRAHMRARWLAPPNPLDPGFEELVRSVLGPRADAFLDRFLEFCLTNPAPTSAGEAYLCARR